MTRCRRGVVAIAGGPLDAWVVDKRLSARVRRYRGAGVGGMGPQHVTDFCPRRSPRGELNLFRDNVLTT